MSSAIPASYTTVHDVIADRVRWTHASLAQLISDARAEGWLPGESLAGAVSRDELRGAIDTRIAATPRTATVLPIEWLAHRLDLDADAQDLLWLLACIETEPSLSRLARVFATPECIDLSVQLVQRLFPVSLRQLATLARLGLIELVTDPRIPPARRPVRLTDRVLELTSGELQLDTAVAAIAQLWPALHDGIPEPGIVSALRSAELPCVIATGPDGAGRATTLARAVGELGFGTLRVRSADLAQDLAGVRRQLGAIVREACLFDVVPMFEDLDSEASVALRPALVQELRDFAGPLLITADTAFSWDRRTVVVHEPPRPDRVTREQLWARALPAVAPALTDEAAGRYVLRPAAIRKAGRSALALVNGEAAAVTTRSIHEGVRAYVGERLGALATRIVVAQSWADLVMGDDQFDQVIEIVARVRNRSTVLDTWGFADKVGRGNGVSALLTGPPGTGKTMVAGLIANELGLDLYQVDLSRVVSKFIGETEKNLATLFDMAETGHAVLLFDEADSLFGKRTEVRSSNDRYANLEVNYLLQRMEAFTGISLLTTNQETAIDLAFQRRLSALVRFPLPDEAQRERLWGAMLPVKARIDGRLELAELANEFEMSGGYIKNAVVRAAYLAAYEARGISQPLLVRSARTEYEAMGKLAYHSSMR